MVLIYKTLFELRLFHEYFITGADGLAHFDEPDQQTRIGYLLDAYAAEAESIDRDIEFGFARPFSTTAGQYNLKLIPTYSGCKVLLRVNERLLADGSRVFEPAESLPDNLNIYISLSRKNNSVDSYTNSRLAREFPAVYFFSNERLPSPKTFPFLVSALSPQQFGYAYEQGELASAGPGAIVEYYKDEGGLDTFAPVTGQVFANENDRLLSPLRFNYSFSGRTDITQADFTLQDNNGNTVKTTSVSAAGTAASYLTSVPLDFSDVSATVSLPAGDSSISNSLFFLRVDGSNGYSARLPLIFDNDLYDRSAWAVVHCSIRPADAAFHLIADDGFLIKRTDPAGIWTEAPIYEIPVKSRLGYFRYRNNIGKELDLAPELTGYLFKSNKMLLSKSPRPLSKYYLLLTDDTGTQTKYLPNPVDYSPQKDDQQRLCFDIKVSASDLFPTV